MPPKEPRPELLVVLHKSDDVSSPVGTAEFSRGRKPTESDTNDPRSRVAATERSARYPCRRYAAYLINRVDYRGLTPTAKLCRRYAANARDV